MNEEPSSPARAASSSPSLWASFVSALFVVSKIHLHSVLVCIPTLLLLLAEFVPTLGMDEKSDAIEDFLLGYLIANNIFFYISIWCCFVATFGFWQVHKHILSIGLPFLSLNMGFLVIGIYFTPISFHLQYLCFIVHHFCFMHALTKSPEPNWLHFDSNLRTKEKKQVQHALTKDGTPYALTKGITAIVVFYALYANIIWPLFDGASLVIKIGLRSLIFPGLFNMLIFLQYDVLYGKSPDSMERRCVQPSTVSGVCVVIGRLMITNTTDILSVVLLAVGSGLIDIVVRWNYIRIFRLNKKILKHAQHSISYITKMRRSFFSSCQPNTSVTQEVHKMPSKEVPESPSYPPAPKVNSFMKRIQVDSVSKLIHQVHGMFKDPEDDENYMIAFHGEQVTQETMLEVKIIVVVPILLYLMKTMQYHFEIKLIDNVQTAFYYILIQWSIYFIFGVICATIESHRLGFLPKPPSRWNWRLIMYNSFMLITCCYLSINSFRIRRHY